MADERHFEVRLVRSGAGRSLKQRQTLEGLGLKRPRHVVFLKDTPPIRGMLYHVVHLISCTVRPGPVPDGSSSRSRARLAAQSHKAGH